MRHNAELRERSRLPLLSSFVRSMRLRWAGHVARMDEASLCRQVMEGRPQGRRPPGRPRLRWRDTIVSDLRQLGVDDPDAFCPSGAGFGVKSVFYAIRRYPTNRIDSLRRIGCIVRLISSAAGLYTHT